MNHIVKALFLVCPLILSGCITVEIPHLVSDTANASVNAYQSLKGKRDAKKRDDANTVSHSYIGNNHQTVAEMKANCETEAAQKLRQQNKNIELRYTLLENDIVATKDSISANCRIALAK